MRAVSIWAIALCLIGAAVFIVTDPFKERGPDLSGALLNEDQIAGGWTVTALRPARADQLLVTPCSQLPVLSSAQQVGFAGRHFARTPAVGPFIEHIVVATGSPAIAADAVAAIRSESGDGCPTTGEATTPTSLGFPSVTGTLLGNGAVAVQRGYTDNVYGTVDEITIVSNTGANIVLIRQTATRGEPANLQATVEYAAAATELARPTGAEPPPSRSTLVGSHTMELASYIDRLGEHRSTIIRGATLFGLLATLIVFSIFIQSRIREIRRRRAALRAIAPANQSARVPRRRVAAPITESSTLDIGQKLLKIKEMNRRDRDPDTASLRAVKLQQQMLLEAGVIDRLNAESGPVARG